MDFLKTKTNKIIKNPLFAGSAIMVVGSNLINVIAYLYHLVMVRLLSLSEYGDLVSTVALIGLIGSLYGFFGLIIVKIVSSSPKKEVGAILNWFTFKAIYLGGAVAFLIFLSSYFISNYLHLEIKIVLLLSPIMFIGLIGFVYKAFLQGSLRFGQLVVSSNIDLILRLSLGSAFVIAGYSVFGAIVGFLLAGIVSAAVSRYFLKDIRSSKTTFKFKKSREVAKLSVPVFALSFMTLSIFSTDLLLVKHYFNSTTAGLYGSLSNMGKIIFYVISPVSTVMFPLISKRHAEKQEYKMLFYLSLAFVLAASSGILLIYYFVPEFAITLLFGERVIEASKYLFMFGVFSTLFSLNILVTSFFLAKDKFMPILMLIAAGATQFFGILVFHRSISEVIMVSLVSMLGLTTSLLVYYWYEERPKA